MIKNDWIKKDSNSYRDKNQINPPLKHWWFKKKNNTKKKNK